MGKYWQPIETETKQLFVVSFRAPNWTIKNAETLASSKEKALANVVFREIMNHKNGSETIARNILAFLKKNKKQYKIQVSQLSENTEN